MINIVQWNSFDSLFLSALFVIIFVFKKKKKAIFSAVLTHTKCNKLLCTDITFYSFRIVISSSSRLRRMSSRTEDMKEPNSLWTRWLSESMSHSTRDNRAKEPGCVFKKHQINISIYFLNNKFAFRITHLYGTFSVRLTVAPFASHNQVAGWT